MRAGRESAALTDRGFPTTGLDLTPGQLRHASERRPAHGYIQGDMRQLPFANGCFAGAWACASLQHVPKTQIVDSRREIRRVLVSGGSLVASVQPGDSEGLVHGRSLRLVGRGVVYNARGEGAGIGGALLA